MTPKEFIKPYAEQDKKLSGIYMIYCFMDNKCYIGQTVKFADRWQLHISRLRKNSHDNSYLQNVYNKYGEPSLCFYILEICEIAQLNYKEGYYLSLIDKEYILNVSPVLPYFRGVKRKKRSDCISFTEDEWTFIKENYTKMYHKDIAKELGVSIKTFVDKTKEYRDNNKEKIKIEQIEFKYKKCHVVTSETKKQLREAASKYHETKTKGKKLSRVQVIEIKNNKNTQYTELAKIYNVSITTISEIKSGRTWKSINSLTNNSSDIINS